MKAKIMGNPDFGHVRFNLNPNERLVTESGAMAHMASNMTVTTKLMGGIIPAVVRRIFAGESLLVSEYSCPTEGEISVSPSLPGQVGRIELNGNEIFFQGGSYLASTPGVKVATKFGGLRALFSGEGAFFLRCHGKGHLWFNAYGAVVEKQVDGELVVDTGHVVGWEQSLDWTVTGVGNLFSTIFSGEGLVLRFKGRGKVWLQTRSVGALVGWMRTYC